MSYSTSPETDFHRWSVQLDAEAAERTANVTMLGTAFIEATQGDVTQPALFARGLVAYTHRPERAPTVAEVMFDALDNKDFIARAMAILARCANGQGSQRDAQELLEHMAECWADSEADFV